MQNTDTSRPSRVKVTRIQDGCFHTCIRQPAVGVAETNSAEDAPRSKTTRPPETLYAFTSPPDVPCLGGRGAVGDGPDGSEGRAAEGGAEADAEGDGEDGADASGEADGDGGRARCVEEARGSVVNGTASGGS